MLKAPFSVPFIWLWACSIAINMGSTLWGRGGLLLVAAQTSLPTAGGGNETLSVSDSKIIYEPDLGRWEKRNYTSVNGTTIEYVRISAFVANPRVNLTFRGSALYYLSPIFSFSTVVRVSIDNSFQHRISLFDNSTAGSGGTVIDPETSDPSGARTFVIAEQLDASTDHTVVVSSGNEDGSAFVDVGQFIFTTPTSTPSPEPTPVTSTTAIAASSSSSRKLKIILPSVLIGSAIIIGVIAGLFLCHIRGKKAPRSLPANRSRGWDATPIMAPAMAFARRFSRRGQAVPPPAPIPPFSPGSEESALKDGDEYEDYIEATAFRRKPSAMGRQDVSAVSKPPYTDRMQSFGNTQESNAYTPARLTQENLQQLGATLSSGPNLQAPPTSISQRRPGRDHRSVVSANTAEMLVRDIPYLPYLHTLAAPSEHGHGASQESQPQPIPPVPLLPQRRSNQSATAESSTRPTVSFQQHHNRDRSTGGSDPFRVVQGRSSSSTESHGSKARASPGLYPSYFPSADPTAALVNEGGDDDIVLTAQKSFKPNRRRGSGETGGTTEGSSEEYGSGYQSMSRNVSYAQAPTPPPKAATSSHPVGARLQGSLRRKAVPTIQELEASSTSTLDRQERQRASPKPLPPPSASYVAPATSHQPPPSQSHSRVTSDSSVRPLPELPRPLPLNPTSPAPPVATTSSNSSHASSSNWQSASTHPKQTLSRVPSPPPSSYHATTGHDFHPAVLSSNPSTSSRTRHDKKPSGGRSPQPRGARSSGGSGTVSNGKERAHFDPAFYPDHATSPQAQAQDDFDDMYVDEEPAVASSPRMFVEGSSGPSRGW